jgi:hypothetical protein
MAFSTKLTGLLVLLGTVYLAIKFMTCDDAQNSDALPSEEIQASQEIGLNGKLVIAGNARVRNVYSTSPAPKQPDSSSGHIVDSVHLSIPGGLTIGGNAKVVTLPASSGRNIVASQQVDLNGKLEIGGNATVRELH